MSWKQQTSGSFENLFNVWGSASNDIWAIGDSQTFLHWNGTAWSTVFTDPGSASGVFGFSTSDIWKVGSDGTKAAAWNWDGSMWIPVATGMSNASGFDAVWGASTTDVWAVGFEGGGSNTAARWNGSVWTPTSTGTNNELHSVRGTSASDVWAVGNVGTIRHWNGSAWSSSTSGIVTNLYGTWAAASNDAWAVGANGVIRHWNGAAWSASTSGVATDLNGVWGFASNDVWAVGASGVIRHWDGVSWNTSTSGTATQLNRVFGFASNDVWVVGSSVTLHWNGSAWSTVASGGGASDVWGAATNDVWQVSNPSHTKHWSGSVWFTEQNVFDGIFGFASNDIWAVGFNGLLRHWDGAAWNAVAIGISGSWGINLSAVWGAATNDVWAVDASSTSGGKILHWNGSAWSVNATPGGGTGLSGVWGFATNDVWACGNDGMFHWDGATWSSVATPAGNHQFVWGSATNDVWAVGLSGVIIHWNGSTWSSFTSPTAGQLNRVWGSASNDVWAVGFNGVTIHWDGVSWSLVTSGTSNGLFGVWSSAPENTIAVGVSGLILSYSISIGGGVGVAFGKPKPSRVFRTGGHGLTGGIHGVQQFGMLRVAPEFNWGIAHVFDAPRYGMGQAKLLDGRIIVTAGLLGSTTDPLDFNFTSTGYVISADGLTFTPIASFPTASASDLIGTTLGDGRALFVGVGGSAQTIHPGTLLWTAQPNIPNISTGVGCTLTTLANGNALLCGGNDNSFNPLAAVYEFDQGSNTWITRPSMSQTRTAHAAVLLSNGNVMVSGPFGVGIEIYDAVNHTWFTAANSPQPGNSALSLLTLSNGKTLACFSVFTGPLYTIRTDIYDPNSNLWTTKTNALNSWWGQAGIAPRNPQLFEIGNGWVAFVSFSLGRTDFYDFRRDFWQTRDPAYPERLAFGDFSIVQLDKNSILTFGASEPVGAFNGGYVLPHRAGRYVEISTLQLNAHIAPTFAGVTSVEGGTAESRVVLHWAAASHPRTHAEDINYFVYQSTSSGGQSFDSPFYGAYANTTAWAGSLSIELFNLAPDTDYYFVVRARDMVATESFINENSVQGTWDSNLVEVHFHTPALGAMPAPSFSWHSTQAMSEPRAFAKGIRLATAANSPNGDVGRYMVLGGVIDISNNLSLTGDVYDQMGLSRVKALDVPGTGIDFAAVDGSPFDWDEVSENRRATVLGGSQFGFGGNLPTVSSYYPYQYSFFANDGFHDQLPDMPVALSKHTAAAAGQHDALGTGAHDILVAGGNTIAQDDTSCTDAAHYLKGYYGDRVFYNGALGSFTVGLTVTGTLSGATGLIEKVIVDTPTQGKLEVSNVVGSFFIGEQITDSSTGDANVTLSLFNRLLWKWFPTPAMFNKRQGHSAVQTSGEGTSNAGVVVAVAGGFNEVGDYVRDVELYSWSLNQWSLLPGFQVNYHLGTGISATFGDRVYVASKTSHKWCFNKFDAYDVSHAGNLCISTDTDAGTMAGVAIGETLSSRNLGFIGESGTFAPGETITGLISGATAKVYAVPLDDGLTGTLVYGDEIGDFNLTELVVGGTSGAAALVDTLTGTDKKAVTTSSLIENIRKHAHFPLLAYMDGLDQKIILLGGSDSLVNDPVDIIDLAFPITYSHVTNLPAARTFHTAHMFGDGQIGIFGGLDNATGLSTNSVKLYNIGANTWTAKPSMGTARHGHVSFLLPNNTVLVLGGIDDSGNFLSSAEISGP